MNYSHLEDTFEAHHVLLVVCAHVHGRSGACASPQFNHEDKVSIVLRVKGTSIFLWNMCTFLWPEANKRL